MSEGDLASGEPAPAGSTGAALPIAAHRDAIERAIRDHPVLIVAGETGSGKSTQLPQYCLQMGRGTVGRIAHTQPRRVAARALAARIATELGEAVGVTAGFQVRFAQAFGPATRHLSMTDGLLLAQVSGDPDLRAYDTLIIDEAHERSLNIDLLFGLTKRLLRRRPDLRVIIASATLDVQRIADFFDGAPAIEVGVRGYPIETRYSEPQASDIEMDLPEAVLEAYRAIQGHPDRRYAQGALVFLPGEREIADVRDALAAFLGDGVDILPLYSRLPWEEQRKVFEAGLRPRIVLATNVAETSLTVPGIHSVIDSGLARISRYSPRNHLQRLPIEPISQAAAEQRKGRCGRLGPGLAWRLYTQEEFDARPLFTAPEILRTDLSSLILRMAADGLGAVEDFEFLDPPDSRALQDGYRTLQELQALDSERRITALGRTMARLPLDVRLSRALVESKRTRAVAELLAIVSFLSIPDPRVGRETDVPAPAGDAARDDARSDLITIVNLWRAYAAVRASSPRRLRQWCKRNRLAFARMADWDNVYLQTKELAGRAAIVSRSGAASNTAIHRAFLAGFVTQIGARDREGAYVGVRGVRFHIAPGSPLQRRKPPWIVAASIIETTRVYARNVAQVEPAWIEKAAAHLLRKEYVEVDWDEAHEQVRARERVALYGLTINESRQVNFGPLDPEAARNIFAREALVHRRLRQRPEWLLDNDAAIDVASGVEDRVRTRGLLADSEVLVHFYESKIPRQVSGADTFAAWNQHLGTEARAALKIPADVLFIRHATQEQLAAFPKHFAIGASTAHDGLRGDVHYVFEPLASDDGASLHLPLLAAGLITRTDIDHAVPGYELERAVQWLRSLPKELRRHFIPIPETARAFCEATARSAQGVRELAEWLSLRGTSVDASQFDRSQVPRYLLPRVTAVSGQAVNESRREGGAAREIRGQFAAAVRVELDRLALDSLGGPWDSFVTTLPLETHVEVAAGRLALFTALDDRHGHVFPTYFFSAFEAEQTHLIGLVRLLRLAVPAVERDTKRSLQTDREWILLASALVADIDPLEAAITLIFRRIVTEVLADVRGRSPVDFARIVEHARKSAAAIGADTRRMLRTAFAAAADVRKLVAAAAPRASPAAAEEASNHLQALLNPREWAHRSDDDWRQIPRYLQAAARRWQKQAERAEAPGVLAELLSWRQEYASLAAVVGAEYRRIPELAWLRALIEEYRSALSAQELKTAVPVSPQRLQRAAAAVLDWANR